MWGGDCRKFLNDELGGGTVKGLLWFILFVGTIALAADTIGGLRNRAILQATADADVAALSGTNDLPDEVVTSVFAYSAGNMPAAFYGSVLKAGVPEE
jgi:hypothetical protein